MGEAAVQAQEPTKLEGTRRAQYAGSWYEEDPAKLSSELSAFLTKASSSLSTGTTNGDARTMAIISPHAGYMFSGSTAAFSYQSARLHPVKRVFLLGPSHHVALKGVALPQAVSFATPLGNLSVDKEIIEELTAYPLFTIQPEVHRVEHSLELQLPFVVQTFGTNVKIVPLVIGYLNDETEIRLIAEIVRGFLTEDDIVVVSSDFTHYGPRYDYQPFKTDVRANIAKLDREAFEHLSKLDLNGWLAFEERTQDTICGFYPCGVLCAMLPDNAHAQLLKYSTSQDIMPDERNNSVSYLAISFSGSGWQQKQTTIELTNEEKETLIQIARCSLETFVREHKVFDAEKAGMKITPTLRRCFGAFVTLYHRTSDEHLRGCIGSIWPVRPLWQTVTENAIAAASRDYRFDPVSAGELEKLTLEINVLTVPHRVKSYEDIVIGRDGIIFSKRGRQSVFLPIVPTEYGWTLERTLSELALKAGLRENDWQQAAKFDVFQSIILKEN